MPTQMVNPMWRCEEEARNLLRAAKILNAEIVRCDKLAGWILFVQTDGDLEHKEAWTAWLADDRMSVIRVDAGFIAEF